MKLVALGLALVAAACGGAAGDAPDAAPLEPTFASIEANILRPKCALPCHAAIEPPAGLDLQTDPYAALVDVPAAGEMCAASGLDRVEPGDPQASLLYRKVLAKHDGVAPPCGEGMPQGARPALSDEEIGVIEEWITTGAMP